MIEQNKYLDLMLLFFKIQKDEDLIKQIKIDLNDRQLILYEYDENIKIRLNSLFDLFFNKYEEYLGNIYHALWNLIHIIPLICNEDCKERFKFFYLNFVITKVDCTTCITHYIYTIQNENEDIFEDIEYIKKFMFNLHNTINENNNKEVIEYDRLLEIYDIYV